MNSVFERNRNSVMEYNEVYFWTATINNWRHLLFDDRYKSVIIDSMRYLSEQNKIKVYAFVIMPNHIHVMWELLEANGKEKPYESFLKHTAHQFQKLLRFTNPEEYIRYNVDEVSRRQRYWMRDPLAVRILSREMAQQKVAYMHLNPLQEHWNLSKEPELYYYSSAYDYSNSFDRFDYLHHYFDRL